MPRDVQVSLSFDDGWKSAITTALPLLSRSRMKGTFYVITDRLNDEEFPLYMNARDLGELAALGHELGVHTRSHVRLPALFPEEAWGEIVNGRQDLRTLGFHPQTFAYPFGEWNARVVKQVREAGFLAARTIIEGYNDEETDPLLLRCHHVVEGTSLREIELWVREAEQSRTWLILMFHQIEEPRTLRDREWIYGTTPIVLEGVCTLLEERALPVVTVEEGIRRFLR